VTGTHATTTDVRDRRLGDDDLAAYLRLRDGSFGYPGGDPEVVAVLTRRLPRTLGAFVGGRLVSSVTVHAFHAYVAGVEVPFGAMAGIQTDPEHRRGGHAARLMRRALDEGRAESFGWSLLYPFDPAFYGRYGWVSFPSSVPLQLPIAALPAGAAHGRGTIARLDDGAEGTAQSPASGAADGVLRTAYARFARTRTFADARRQTTWDPWEDLAAAPGTRLLRFAGADAFLVLRLVEEAAATRLDVVDAGWCDATGRAAVFGTIAAFRGQAATVRIEVPWDDPVAADRLRTHAWAAPPGPMARVADVALALGAWRALADDDTPLGLAPVTVRLIDAYAPWNDGSWRIEPGPDGCTVAPAAGGAAATVDVRGLALLLAGAAAPGDLRRLGLVEGDGRALATLGALAGGRTAYRSPIDRF
jgi:predicted acetyltransferase